MPSIEIIIEKDGTAKVEAFGWTGPSCATLTAPFINALGIKTAELPKTEMFQQQTTAAQVQQ